jgi:gamma-glutamylputrescine oxidase
MALLDIDRELTRNSYYAATAPAAPRHAPLAGRLEVDVAVVGAGLAGLCAALELAERGFKVAVLEARQVGWGASGRNGGQAIHGLACDMAVIEAQLGQEQARRVWDMTIEAIQLLRERCARHAIDCDWRDGFLGVATSAKKADELRTWADRTVHLYGYPLTWIAPPDMAKWIASPRYHSAIHDPRSGHLHPLKYCQGLARAATGLGVALHEDTPVQHIEPGPRALLHTARGQVSASQVLLAGNVYLQGVAPWLERRIMPVGTYIVCSEPLGPERVQALIPSGSAVCDTNFVLDYFRPTPDHRLLYGGRVSYSTATPPNLVASMARRMTGTFPHLAGTRIEYSWGGFVDISMNRAPDFGRLGTGAAANVYYLQGFSGHGLALTGLAGRLVAEAIAGDVSRFDTFARIRHRPFPGGKWLRTPALVLGMAYHRLRDVL